MVLVANNNSSEVLQPSKKALDIPAPLVPSHRPPVLSDILPPVGSMRSDQLNATLCREALIKGITVIRFIADDLFGKVVSMCRVEGIFDQSYFVRGSALHVDGERKTSAVCKGHDLRPLATLGLANTVAPFLAPAKEPSINASERSRSPCCWRSSAREERSFLNTPARVHRWNQRWHVWCEGYRSGKSFHGAPVRRIQRIPSKTSRESHGGRPRPPGFRFGSGISGWMRIHCRSVRSMHSISTSYPVKVEALSYF